jgi:hypothetical protein
MVYVEQQRLDGTDHAAAHAVRQKNIFDKKVLQLHAGKVIFKPGKLVQVYVDAMDMPMGKFKETCTKASHL